MRKSRLTISEVSDKFFVPFFWKRNVQLQYVAGVSWPRSGHHLVRRVLRKYFGKKFRYCEFYTPDDCCKTFPCARAGQIHYSKNHDHDFDVPQLDDVKYLIQFRDFSHAVVSNFELHVKRGGGPDTVEEFRRFASEEWTDHRSFLQKWVTSDFAKSHLVMEYRELTTDPENSMAKVISHFAPSATINRRRLRKIINSINGVSHNSAGAVRTGKGVKQTRVLQEFRFYDPNLFMMLERLKISRQTVTETFREVLGRDPDETDMLELQCSKSCAELRLKLQDQLDNRC